MKIILNEEEMKELKECAKQYGIEPDRLHEAYEQAMSSDLYQDLWDIVSMQWQELGGRDFEQEAYKENVAWDKLRNGA